MENYDLNLLTTLDALLAEGSVTGAAERLHLSVAATSRALGRLRRVLDDPILVRAGRQMVLTPRALSLAPRVQAVLAEARGIIDAGRGADLRRLERTMTIRLNDATLATFGAGLVSAARRDAPGITLHLAGEGDEDVRSLRDGSVDLDLGMIRHTAPELIIEQLYTEQFVALVAPGHPLSDGPVTLPRLAQFPHLSVSRRGRSRGPLDDAFDDVGLRRSVVVVVGSFTAAVSLLFGSDLIGLAARSFAHHIAATTGLRVLSIPVELPPLPMSMAWHPRHSADPGHSWLRTTVREVALSVVRKHDQAPPDRAGSH